MSVVGGKVTKPPKHQPDAVLNQANPVSGTKYTVLDTTRLVKITAIAVRVIWTVQPTPLEIHITIDGITINHSIANPVTNTWYFPIVQPANPETAQTMTTAFTGATYAQPTYEANSIKIEAETTGGTVQSMEARVKYAKY